MKPPVQSRVRILTELSILVLMLLLFSGCASTGLVTNMPRTQTIPSSEYSIRAAQTGYKSGDISLILAFSGGGTRAAALAFSVLLELRDTSITIDGNTRRLLDADYIVTNDAAWQKLDEVKVVLVMDL